MEFQFGDWLVSPEANIVSNGDAKTQLEPRVMAVLRYLCRHPGAVIPAEEILQACWGSNELGDNPVHKAITQLRRAFGDSSTEPRYIETIRKRGYRAIAPVITLASPAPTTWEGGSPFRGLEAFQENHAAIFFGRVQATSQLRELVLTQAAHGYPMALVLGPSGSGKTSLVRAGLLPQLMAGATRSDEPIGLTSTVYLDCADLGSGTLFQALAGALIDADINGEPLFPGASADSLGQRLASDPDAVAAELLNRTCARPQVGVFVDRLEAVFRADAGEANLFFTVIEALAKSNCLLMLMACRNDFYPEVMAQPVLLALKTRGAHFDVLPPDGADIAQIVRQPASAASLTFETDDSTGASLDDVLCDASRGNPDMLPLLQYTLNELYRQRDENGVLRFAVYRQLGGIEGAVGVRAEQVVSRLNPKQIAALPHVLSLLVNVGDDQGTVTSRRSPLSLLRTEDERELVRVMIEARLFVSELTGDVPSFGVAHEALLRQWPRVATWIEQHRNSLQLRTRVAAQASRWADAGRSRDLLLPRGSQVNQAAELLEIDDFSLADIERDYVKTSIRRAQLAQRVIQGITALVALLAVLTTVFGFSARSSQQEAERNRSEAEGLMTYMLGDFVEKLRPIGRLDLLDDIGSKALIYLGRKDGSDGSAASLVSRIKALIIIAEVNANRNHVEVYNQALTSARSLILDASGAYSMQPEFLQQAGSVSFSLGQFNHQRNDLSLAEKYYNEYRDYSEKYSAIAPNAADGLLERSYAYNALGTLAMTRADYSSAAKAFDRSLQFKREAAQLRPLDEKRKAELATTISWHAESVLKLGAPPEAMKLYRAEEDILRSLHDSSPPAQSKLATSLLRQALLGVALGQRNEAIQKLLDAETILQKLVDKDPTNRLWKSRLLQAEGRLAETQLTPNNAKEAFTRLQSVCEQMDALLKEDPKNTFLIYQTVKFELGRSAMLQMLGREEDAARNADAALIKLSALHEKSKNDKVLLGFLTEALMVRSELARRLAGDEAAKSYCKTTAELLNDQPQSSSEYTLLAPQVRASLCLGDVDAALSRITRLQSLSYREAKYQQFISTHPLLKGKL
ncbi:transcriptional regulator [Pseudoduganella eburnea]|uniref:Transcriptional regulator n=1 Tax=Massilia eburnea TaxID=1776165 RepID=A0A6L6QKY1_9BURK|nr:winged helix-turn-helix domain-containing protein [Massilia eburnea]MTW12835.1 transcriptional regulator [Massilia eburnea]